MKSEIKNKIDLTANVAVIFNNENANEARVAKALQRASILTICDLCCHTAEDLLAIKNIGQTSVVQIENHLKELGLSLDMSEEELTTYSKQATDQPINEGTSEKPETSASDDNPENCPPEQKAFMEMLDFMCEDIERKRVEQRRYELAREIYIRDTIVFASDQERAEDAIRKADVFIEVYYKD